MCRKVEVSTVGHTFEFTPIGSLEAELVFNVDGTLRIVGQLLLRMLIVAQVLRFHAKIDVPLGACVEPVLVPFLIGTRSHEEFHFHLFELAGTEDEVARGDFITEGLAHVGDAERRLGTRRGHHVLEVHENALRGFRTQVVQRVFVFDRSEVGTQHHVEVARFGPVATGATIRAHNILKTVFRQLVAMLFGIGFLKLVCTVALVAVEAFDQWIVEHGHVAGSHPHSRRKNNGRVNAHHIATGDDHGTPPFTLDIVFQRDAERTVIPRGTGSAVDFTGGKNKATTLGEGYDFIEFGYSHNAPSGLNGLGSLQAQSLPSRGDRTPPNWVVSRLRMADSTSRHEASRLYMVGQIVKPAIFTPPIWPFFGEDCHI